jgi:hypothetical protein
MAAVAVWRASPHGQAFSDGHRPSGGGPVASASFGGTRSGVRAVRGIDRCRLGAHWCGRVEGLDRRAVAAKVRPSGEEVVTQSNELVSTAESMIPAALAL